jgi:hypothetical protein
LVEIRRIFGSSYPRRIDDETKIRATRKYP